MVMSTMESRKTGLLSKILSRKFLHILSLMLFHTMLNHAWRSNCACGGQLTVQVFIYKKPPRYSMDSIKYGCFRQQEYIPLEKNNKLHEDCIGSCEMKGDGRTQDSKIPTRHVECVCQFYVS